MFPDRLREVRDSIGAIGPPRLGLFQSLVGLTGRVGLLGESYYRRLQVDTEVGAPFFLRIEV